MRALALSKAASADLRNIYAYTFSKWGERHADTYLDNLRLAMDSMADGTAIVRPLISRHENLFKLKQGRHLIVYQQHDEHQLLVLRVLHESMDFDAQLAG